MGRRLFALPTRLRLERSMRSRTSCHRIRRRGCSPRYTLAGVVDTFRACSSRRTARRRGTDRRVRSSSGRLLSLRTLRPPHQRPPGRRPDIDRDDGSKRHANAPRSRCCSCVRHSRTRGPTLSCRPWVVACIRPGPRPRRNTGLRCTRRRDRSGTRPRLHRDRSSPPDQPGCRVQPTPGIARRFAATRHASGPRRC